jgi:2-succinyl-5-enolpyruvyl-6-hydroxy-3-cyclohexene-1-carboxylate synthase
VIHVGGRIVSQNWFRFLASHPPRSYLHLHRAGDRIDPQHLSPCRRELSSRTHLPPIRLRRPSPPAFRQRWQQMLDQLHEAIGELLLQSETLSEPGIARAIGELLPSGHALFLGNSMPIRDFDQFASWEMERDVLVGANRGASGIDGLIASAVGFAMGSHRPTTLVIGDLSFLHDMNSLALARKSAVPMVIVVVNNDGGGIFQFLPVADHARDFERLFAMPHGLCDFSRAAEMFSIPYVAVHSLPDLRREYSSALQDSQTRILELRTDRTQNAQYHRWLRSELATRLAAPSSSGPRNLASIP